MAEPPAIRVVDLRKRYAESVDAVRGVSFEIARGEIFGLIGPDGAGKTSTFQILGGVMEATAGTAVMLGLPAREARTVVGYLTQVFSLYPDLSVAENLRYVGELRRLSRRVGLDDLSALCGVIGQAHGLGAPVGNTLREFAESSRRSRMSMLEERAGKLAAQMSPEQIVVVNLSGRGDKDIHTVAQIDGIQF